VDAFVFFSCVEVVLRPHLDGDEPMDMEEASEALESAKSILEEKTGGAAERTYSFMQAKSQLRSKAQLRVLAAAEKLAGLGEKAGPEVTLLMQELEELAERIARADEMRKQAAASPPAKDGEAAKWHDVALVTLNWSQQELLKRQKAALLRLVEIAEQPESKAGVAAQPSATGQLVPFIQQEPAVEEKSMKKDLEALRLHNPDCVLIVRKIKKLGWESPALLRKYFEQYGKVREIFVTHSTMKPNPKRPGGRARPAALGFIVMADKQGKAAVLSRGKEQFVLGVAIDVAAFNPFLDTNWDEATE